MKTLSSHPPAALMALVLIALATVLTSCSHDPAPLVPALEKSRLPFPDTPDQLMANFVEAYGDQDLAEYAALLHPDFVFELTSGSVPQTWDRDQELAIAARMFSREDLVKAGRTVAGIGRIEIVRFVGSGEWRAADDVDSGGDGEDLERTYAVFLRFHMNDGGVLVVRGASIFRVRREALDDENGGMRPGYRLVRQIDRTG